MTAWADREPAQRHRYESAGPWICRQSAALTKEQLSSIVRDKGWPGGTQVSQGMPAGNTCWVLAGTGPLQKRAGWPL